MLAIRIFTTYSQKIKSMKNLIFYFFSDVSRFYEDQAADERVHGVLALPAAAHRGAGAGHPQRRDLQAAGTQLEGDGRHGEAALHPGG